MRLMIVDDNKQVREGISLGISWEEYGISEVQVYADGLEAKQALKAFLPDLVIADIRMPNMDGLELLEEVRRANRRCRYILLSAYSEFEYAQKAIRLGADDYILKPVKPKELIDIVMKNIRLLLNEQKENESFFEIYEKSFLHSLSEGGTTDNPARLKQMMKSRYHLSLDSGYALLALARIEAAGCRIRKAPVEEKVRLRILEAFRKRGYAAAVSEDTILFLDAAGISALENLELKMRLKNYFLGLNRELLEEKTVVTCAIADAALLSGLPQAFCQAREAMELTYYREAGACVAYGEERTGEPERFAEERQKDWMERVSCAVRTREREQIRKIFEELFLEGMERQYRTGDMREFLKRLYLYLTRYASVESSLEFERQVLEQDEHFEPVIHEFVEYICQFAENARGKGVENYSAVIRNICVYMNEHFKEPLSVENIAVRFHRTPNYISAKFKKEVGKSFTDYLIELRIQKAVTLLTYSDIPIKDVARETGFGSYAYFSRIFRKYTGKNAGAYRGENLR